MTVSIVDQSEEARWGWGGEVGKVAKVQKQENMIADGSGGRETFFCEASIP